MMLLNVRLLNGLDMTWSTDILLSLTSSYLTSANLRYGEHTDALIVPFSSISTFACPDVTIWRLTIVFTSEISAEDSSSMCFMSSYCPNAFSPPKHAAKYIG